MKPVRAVASRVPMLPIAVLALALAGAAHAAVPASEASTACELGNPHAGDACAAPQRPGALPLTRTALAAPADAAAEPAAAAPPPADLDHVPMGWKERLAVVGACAGALLFLLMRQLAGQRPSTRPSQRPRPAPHVPTPDGAPPPGYMLSQFDSLQALPPASGGAAAGAPRAPLRRVKVHAARAPQPRRRTAVRQGHRMT